MVTASTLSEQDLAAARAELAGGRPVTVWFTAAAVGVPAGGSAKVVSIEDPPEGDFVQVRPAGSRDTMFCSPNELTRERPARKRTPKAAPEPAPRESAAPQPSTPVPTPRPAPAPAPVPAPIPARTPPPAPALTVVPTPEVADEPAEPPAERARPSAGRASAARPPAGVVVTLTATPEGEWSVEVVVGKKRTVRPTPVSPGEVAKAARALPAVVTEAIESSLEAARTRQVERVERLRAELEAAQQALQDLSD